MSLLNDIRADANYKKYEQILAKTRSRLDLESAMKEVMALHTSRTSRSLMGEDRYSPKKLIDASMKDLSSRARMVEIRVKNDQAVSHLKAAMSTLQRYLTTEYNEELREQYSTVGQRQQFVDRVMKSANELVEEAEALFNTIDQFVRDIDQSGHSMRHIIDCLKLLQGTKGGQVI